MSVGNNVGPINTGDGPPDDTGEAIGLGPSNLTVTFGFGASLFSDNGMDRFGLAKHRPMPLVDLPAFHRDALQAQIRQLLLLLLDDAVGSEQVRPLLPGTAGSLVLVTSRRRLTALEDAHAISLDTLPPMDAAQMLVRLAPRASPGAGNPAVAEITGPTPHTRPSSPWLCGRSRVHH